MTDEIGPVSAETIAALLPGCVRTIAVTSPMRAPAVASSAVVLLTASP